MPPRQPAAARAPPPRGRKAPAARAGPRLRLGRPRPRAHRKNPARTGPQPPTRRQRVTASMTTWRASFFPDCGSFRILTRKG